jgi:elongation factor Ts
MAITAEMVRLLREKTSAPMMDCKKALSETEGDFDKAVTLLRERGVAVAAKRESRSASEGVIAIYISDDSQTGVMAELNCETTFVAKTDEFKALANNIASHVGHCAADAEDNCIPEVIMNQKFFADETTTLMDMLNLQVAKLGEKTALNRVLRIDVGGPAHEYNGIVGSYLHMGDRIGVLVELKCESDSLANNEAFQQLGKDLAMHVSWSNPEYLSRECITPEAIEKEREVHKQWAIKEGKPEKIIDKIIDGRMKEFYSRACLLEQPFIKDQDTTIQGLLDVFQKDAGEQVWVVKYVRFGVGETSVDA